MSNCRTIDPLVTRYVDNELPDGERELVDQHMRACPPCQLRVHAERAVHDLIQTRRKALGAACAPPALHARCAAHAWRRTGASTHAGAAPVEAASARPVATPGREGSGWRRAAFTRGGVAARASLPSSRFAPLALAASLVLIVGAAFLYQLTASSSRVMAAELAADHLKCFAMNDVLHPHQTAATVESSMLSGFGWRMHVPSSPSATDLELIGSRLCVYGDGRVAHIMYRHHGEPLSLFMLPEASRAREEEIVQVVGHRAAIWCDGERTFVLVGRQPKEEVERMALVVRKSMK
jgi:anti-sigma factor RsiW